jgi:hypothetical protein
VKKINGAGGGRRDLEVAGRTEIVVPGRFFDVQEIGEEYGGEKDKEEQKMREPLFSPDHVHLRQLILYPG